MSTSRSFLLLLMVVMMGMCTMATFLADPRKEPGEFRWERIKSVQIAQVDPETGIYVSGTMGLFGGGSIDSKSVIDYQYAERLSTGALRIRLVSQLYAEAQSSWLTSDYPGSQAVTVYEDATQAQPPRIDVYQCVATGEAVCVLPDGAELKESLRIDVHVPKGTVSGGMPSLESSASK